MKRITMLAAACALLVSGGCGSDDDDSAGDGATTGADASQSSLPQGSEHVDLEPTEFTTKIDNPYWPMAPGNRWVYREGDEQVVVTVTSETKKVDGITARVIYDVGTKNGEPIEKTFDWYAQDAAGNIWYLGEDTKEYENGKVSSTSGSWEAGVDGAEGGVIMPADPRVGLTYRQEYYEGEAEDHGEILSLDETVKVPFGTFDGALKTRDVAPLPPRQVEHKYYARGVGPVLTVGASGHGGRSELLRFTKGR